MSSAEMTNEPLTEQPSTSEEQPREDEPTTPITAAQPEQQRESATPVSASQPAPDAETPRPSPPPRPPFVPREERERRRREALAGLVVGEWREGKVTGIAQFGAFVDLGGVDGLVHVSQLGSGGYVEKVEDVVQVGQTVRVRVAEVDLDRGRVSLSMREPRPAGPPRDRQPAAPAVPRPPRPAGAPTPAWPSEPPPEARHDRRARGGERGGPNRGEERAPRRNERSRRSRENDDEDWRSVRGDPRNFYSFGDEEEEEPAPATAEELVARFGRRGNNK